MRSIFGSERALVQQPQVRLMDQGRTLQSMTGAFSLQVIAGDVAEFLVNQRNQGFESFLVARLPTHE